MSNQYRLVKLKLLLLSTLDNGHWAFDIQLRHLLTGDLRSD